MASYPDGVGITVRGAADLEASDMDIVGSEAGTSNPYQAAYSEIKAGIVGTPGNIGGVVPATEIETSGDVILSSDLAVIRFGAGQDMTMGHNGTIAYIDTDQNIPTDLTLYCGTGKTLELSTTVWEDLNFAPGASGGNAQTVPAFVVINNVIYREFDSSNNELVGSTQEVPHNAALSTNLIPHLHLFIKSGESVGTTGVTFTVYWELRDNGAVTNGSVALTATSAELTANPYEFFVTDATGFAGSAELGAQLALTLARTGGDAGDVIVTTYGVHYQIDTIGSRLIGSK